MRFGRGKAPSFKHRPGTGLPRAHIAAARRRYAAMLREAGDILPRLPAPVEMNPHFLKRRHPFFNLVVD